MPRSDDALDKAVDVAFNLPIAGAAFARDFTKFALHQMAVTARVVVAGAATRVADQRAAAASPGSVRSGRPASVTSEPATLVGEAVVVDAAAGHAVDGEADSVEVAVAIEGYDQLTARQIVALIDSLRTDELQDLHAYETSKRARRTVLTAISTRLGN